MAKGKTGLPEDFDISVSAADLTGPASLPGYLDEDPVLELAKLRKQQAQQKNPEPASRVPQVFQPPVLPPMQPERVAADVSRVAAPVVVESPKQQLEVQTGKTPEIRRRLQINLGPEADRMVEELLDLLSSQSGENRIKISELIQALVLNLYNAKGEIALGSLPVRGRWGSPTARSFPVALAEACREAIITHDQVSGGNPFKKAVGS